MEQNTNKQPATTPVTAPAPVQAPVQVAPAPVQAPVQVPAAAPAAQVTQLAQTQATPVQPSATAVIAAKPVSAAVAPTAAAAPAAQVAQPIAAPAAQKPATAPTANPAAQKQAASSKKFILGCIGAFGCSLFLFIAVIFGFLAFGSTNSPIFSFLGVAPTEVYNVIFSLTNLIFLVLVFITFIFFIVGIFKRVTARKDDAVAKRGGNIFVFFATILLIFFIVAWVFAYFYLVDKRTTGPRRDPIITVPVSTVNITAPVTISFDGSKALSGRTDLQILSYNWNFGDGSSARGEKQTHTFTELGDYKVVLTINVKYKQSGEEQSTQFTRDVTINNVLAKVVIKANPLSGPAPLEVNFDASDSSSENGELTEFAWDFDGDGEFDDSTDSIASYTFEEIKKYTVTLRVTDSSGQLAENSVEITATEPDDPIPVIAIEGVTGTDLTAGTSYMFSGVQSSSPKGKIEKYAWEFSDGTTAQTRTVKHTFAENGEYEVTLKITDAAKQTAEKTVRFTVGVASQAPTITVTTLPVSKDGVITGEVPFEVEFDASASTDSNDEIVEYKWDFESDGKIDDTNEKVSHTFTKAGTYTVKVTAIDSTDLSTDKTFKVVATQKGLSVDLKATPDSGSSPLKVNFDASGSSYPDGRIVSYEWDFGDGSKPRLDAAKVTYQYNRIGTFSAKVTAITNDNKRAEGTFSISVRPVSLSACFESSVSGGVAPLTISFDALCSVGTIIRYTWDFGGLKKSNERKPSFTFIKAGEYEVKLEIRDTENVIDTFSKTIIVK